MNAPLNSDGDFPDVVLGITAKQGQESIPLFTGNTPRPFVYGILNRWRNHVIDWLVGDHGIKSANDGQVKSRTDPHCVGIDKLPDDVGALLWSPLNCADRTDTRILGIG